jgi:hypothetical protein
VKCQNRREKEKGSVWVRKWIRKGNQLGASSTFTKKLASEDRESSLSSSWDWFVGLQR